jgi:hypothetical protein
VQQHKISCLQDLTQQSCPSRLISWQDLFINDKNIVMLCYAGEKSLSLYAKI